MKLRKGYELVMTKTDGQPCGDGGRSEWELRKKGCVITVFESCHCGRGCGNKDCVRDDWGYHDCHRLIERVRVD